MGKPIAIIAAGVLVFFMGLRSLSGYDTEIEQLYAGQTVTVTCRDGKPSEGEGLEMQTALDKCSESRSKQRSSVRFLFAGGAVLMAWGWFDLRKVRSS